MEKDSDVQLIQRILSGDEAAFDVLVHRHQKSVHALAWRKIGDFHDAEEITQDTFLQVYKKLPTLKDPYKFAGWLYVIANRLCIDRMRQKKLTIQSLEDTPVEDVEKSSYTHHVSEQRQTEISEHRRALVKTLLEKLPESERTVMTLFYLGEMTVKEISKFLGVSASAIHNRLYRARKRLQEEEARLVQEILGGVQIPASVSQNIMQRVADVKLTPASAPKPLLPWVALGAAVALATLLMLSASNQYLARFQKPYSFQATSEPTVEIIDVPIVRETDAKPAVRNQIGQTTPIRKHNSVGFHDTDRNLTPNASAESLRLSEPQWIPDTALRQAVRETLELPTHHLLTPMDLQPLTDLDARSKGIVNLAGLEYATNLRVLILIENKIRDISPLSGLTKLIFLDLGGNEIVDLRPLAALPLLETLKIWRNRIEDITPLAGLGTLKELLIENNDIRDFSPIYELTHLEVLHKHGNFLDCEDIPRVAIKSRIEGRDYPSVFSAGHSEAFSFSNVSADEKLGHYDLSWGGPGFHLQSHPTSQGLWLFGSVDDPHWEREYLISENPNFIRLVSLDYTGIPLNDYTKEWPYWIRDENGNRVQSDTGRLTFLIDFTHPAVQDILIQKALAVATCGLYDGIFLDGWHEDRVPLDNDKEGSLRSVEAARAARISMVRRMREVIDDDFLIIVNTDLHKARLSAPYVNGAFIAAVLDEGDTAYTYDHLREIERMLLWSEQNFREPQINALEGRGIPFERPDSPQNQQRMRLMTTLSLTHSDGYVCYVAEATGTNHKHEYETASVSTIDPIAGERHNHTSQRYWYPFWDADLGHPVGEKARLYRDSKGHPVEGLFIREFTNGWAAYNRSGKPQNIQLSMQVTGVASGITTTQHTLSDLDGEIYLK